MRLNEEVVLEIRLNIQEKARWCSLCPRTSRKSVIWATHQQAHSGMSRTLSRLRLTWYWPGMAADVRKLVRTCEVCQVAKPGGLQAAGSRQRLYAGRPWQVVAIDVVGPMPESPRGKKWILVLTDHFTRWQDAIALPDATTPTIFWAPGASPLRSGRTVRVTTHGRTVLLMGLAPDSHHSLPSPGQWSSGAG